MRINSKEYIIFSLNDLECLNEEEKIWLNIILNKIKLYNQKEPEFLLISSTAPFYQDVVKFVEYHQFFSQYAG